MARAKKSAKRPRPPERDYSHRLLLDKLGVKQGQNVAVHAIRDSSFLADLGSRVPKFSRDSIPEQADLIFVGVEDMEKLAQLKTLAKAMQKNSAIWVVYPKGQKHIREVDVIAAGKSAGLVDNKVCRFSETHTALRFVIPVAKR